MAMKKAMSSEKLNLKSFPLQLLTTDGLMFLLMDLFSLPIKGQLTTLVRHSWQIRWPYLNKQRRNMQYKYIPVRYTSMCTFATVRTSYLRGIPVVLGFAFRLVWCPRFD